MGRGWRKRKHYPQVTSQQNQPAPTRTTAVAVSQSFSGPLPPPEVLEHYERIAPGTAERLLAMAESQSAHRQGHDAAVLKLLDLGSRQHREGANECDDRTIPLNNLNPPPRR